NFTLIVTATSTDSDNPAQTNTTVKSVDVTVNPLAPSATWAAATPGTEGNAITLGTLTASANGFAGDTNTINSVVISGIPVGDTLSDGNGHSFTATGSTTSTTVTNWTLSSLKITTV